MKDHERAMQAWSALALAASHRQTLTYQMLSRLIGVPARGLAHILMAGQSRSPDTGAA